MKNQAGRPTKEDSEKLQARRRSELLQAAYLIVAEKGLEGLRTRDIAEKAGINISTLHYYFHTKEDLLVALLRYTCDIFAARPESYNREDESLQFHLESAWQSFRQNPQLLTVLQEFVLHSQRDLACREVLQAVHEEWNRFVEEILKEGIQKGQLRPELDTKSSARMITSFIMGASMQLGINPQAFDFDVVAQQFFQNFSSWKK